LYLWGHLKALVYAAPVDNEETLHRRIVDASEASSMTRGVEACAESHGGHSEHLL
jgi:hypothetical protein